MRRVLVTRPEPGASRTARRLLETGFQPILLPLTETVSLPVDTGLVPDNASAVAATSANALRHASKDLLAMLSRLPCHAVGKMTAEAARQAGLLSIGEGPGDAEALAEAIAPAYTGKSILYPCGRVRFPAFEQRLRAAGVHVHAVETYDTRAMDYPDEAAIVALLSSHPVDAVLLYSAKAAAAMRDLIRRPALREYYEKTCFFALSARIGAAFDDAAGARIRFPAQPEEDAMLALLREWR
ncbi:uroporphyrinogen-III synthase [Mesorhizobium sp. ES1-1]|uniref:uroporphyrinogen-III synthase n=1 Tax=Mesorhizobium sp. ES1-1 TaxID=2876629 RepID=UPI001CCA1AD9|nr:uroporphyrinogen-III synthase [Mesorhizobium sp. ES1-1]MBZ9675394.1 uroporphyrinogen-III synthase [Mesorhizobium sp. ES1-1]